MVIFITHFSFQRSMRLDDAIWRHQIYRKTSCCDQRLLHKRLFKRALFLNYFASVLLGTID